MRVKFYKKAFERSLCKLGSCPLSTYLVRDKCADHRAGLGAAWHLIQQGYEVDVLEASPHPGRPQAVLWCMSWILTLYGCSCQSRTEIKPAASQVVWCRDGKLHKAGAPL